MVSYYLQWNKKYISISKHIKISLQMEDSDANDDDDDDDDALQLSAKRTPSVSHWCFIVFGRIVLIENRNKCVHILF